MARRNVKVEIPIGSPDEMETLTDAILARHTALGANSPLTGEVVDMVIFSTLQTQALQGKASQQKTNY